MRAPCMSSQEAQHLVYAGTQNLFNVLLESALNLSCAAQLAEKSASQPQRGFSTATLYLLAALELYGMQ